MFTGIIRGIGRVDRLDTKNSILRYAVQFPPNLLDGLERGASVSVDGICQTIVSIDQDRIEFEAIAETLERTTLKNVQIDQKVNLERAARFGDEIGGHLLSGHVYGVASIVSIEQNVYTFSTSASVIKYLFSKGYVAIDGISLTLVDVWEGGPHFRANCKTRGPRKIDDFGDNFECQLAGTCRADENIPEWVGEEARQKLPPKARFYEGREFCNWLFTVHLIPETLTHTTIGQKKVGSLVNIEIDSLTQAAVDTLFRLTHTMGESR